jgi:hypothetical protein
MEAGDHSWQRLWHEYPSPCLRSRLSTLLVLLLSHDRPPPRPPDDGIVWFWQKQYQKIVPCLSATLRAP